MNERKALDTAKIEQIQRDRKEAHKFFTDKSKVYRIFTELEEKTFQDGSLSKKHKELIAVGISLVNSCESCLEWHIKQALDAGATLEEVIEALEVGLEMGIGPTTVTNRFAMKVLKHYLGDNI
ncbi:MAG: carboxymuconolactone decarboxylase family protein [Candidatus Krumholzibacteria bacterium]|jgi:AhpD family alkylhydroperoxidase|nr:carboxymuconolactone decarboxylase family protein [Candidatus Krumholzibacteria bacterium]